MGVGEKRKVKLYWKKGQRDMVKVLCQVLRGTERPASERGKESREREESKVWTDTWGRLRGLYERSKKQKKRKGDDIHSIWFG